MNDIYCNRCGETSPHDAQFSIGCGLVLVVNATAAFEAQPAGLICPDCYTPNVREQFNCMNCGRRLQMEYLTFTPALPDDLEGTQTYSAPQPDPWKISKWDILIEFILFLIEIAIE
jgi:hypothetical protein